MYNNRSTNLGKYSEYATTDKTNLNKDNAVRYHTKQPIDQCCDKVNFEPDSNLIQ